MQLPGYPDVNIPDTLGELLTACRVLRGLSRVELADKIGVKTVSIAKYEKAGSPSGQNPPIQKLIKLSVALDIDPRFMFACAAGSEEEVKALLEKNYENQLEDFQVFGSTLSETMKEMFQTPSKIADFLSGNAPALTKGSPDEAAMQIVGELVTPENLLALGNALKEIAGSPAGDLEVSTKAVDGKATILAQSIDNKKSPEEDLPSPPGSNPKTPHVEKESEDGQAPD